MAVTHTGRKHSSGADGDFYFSIESTFNTVTDKVLITGNFYISEATKDAGGQGDFYTLNFPAASFPFDPAVHQSFDGYMDAVVTAALTAPETIADLQSSLV